MKSYRISGLIDIDVAVCNPPFVKGTRDGCWISANNIKEAKKEFIERMLECYGITINPKTITISY